eukprot:5845193-Prymnesium_polylepis.1
MTYANGTYFLTAGAAGPQGGHAIHASLDGVPMTLGSITGTSRTAGGRRGGCTAFSTSVVAPMSAVSNQRLRLGLSAERAG